MNQPPGLSRAVGAGSVDRDVVPGYLEPFGHFQFRAAIIGGKIDIKYASAFVAVKMAMLVHVRAVTHGSPVEIDLFDQGAFYQEIETVIDRRHRNIGHAFFCPHENLLSRRMIALMHEHAIDVLALRSKPETPASQSCPDLGFESFKGAAALHISNVKPNLT
jgi:hypothetical protein